MIGYDGSDVVLVIGSEGQIGSELVPALRKRYGRSRVIGADLRRSSESSDPFREIDVTDRTSLQEIVRELKVTVVYHLASILSVTGEKAPDQAWFLNIEGLRNVLEISREERVRRVFWPSSIAAFGPRTPRTRTPQFTVMDPSTIYGITKAAGEMLCNYAFTKYNLDVRCLRFPGVVSWKTPPGGGTTDFAIAMFHGALRGAHYTCFLAPDTTLPMMYMPDVIRGTLQFMEAPCGNLRTHFGYNLAGMSFTPRDLEIEIRRHVPEFVCAYEPDDRQRIADSWPRSISAVMARRDWGWKPSFTMRRMVDDMVYQLRQLIRSGHFVPDVGLLSTSPFPAC
jgi:nucleoside-diphosphate-sugar epimerase